MKQVALILTVAFGLNWTAISRVLSFILKYIMLFEKKNKSKGSIETQGKTWIQTWTLLLAYRLSSEKLLKPKIRVKQIGYLKLHWYEGFSSTK